MALCKNFSFIYLGLNAIGRSTYLFKNFFKVKSDNHNIETDVVIGSRFYQVGGTESIWVVERLFKPTVSDVQHAVLVREGRQPTTKMVSISALFDSNIFCLERRNVKSLGVEADIEKINKARRRSDTKVSS